MSKVIVEQRNATSNQSTLDYKRENIFTYGNRFSKGTYKNTTGDVLTLKTGMLVARSTTIVDGLIPVTSANLANVIGIAFVDDTELADTETKFINFAISGDVDGGLLVLPATVTLNTVVGAKVLKDILTDLNFVVNNVTELSKTEN